MTTLYNGDPANITTPVSKTVTGATNATPIVITTSVAHTFGDNDYVNIASVGGNTAANGQWKITKLSATTFSLDGSVGSGAYTAGGTAIDYSLTPELSEPADGDLNSVASILAATRALADRTQHLALRVQARIDIILTTGTWKAPPGCPAISVEYCSGGGGGAGGNGAGTATSRWVPGGGGGEGSPLVTKNIVVVPGTTYPTTIGAGGTAGVGGAAGTLGGFGGDGGVTSFGTSQAAPGRGGYAATQALVSAAAGTGVFAPGGCGGADAFPLGAGFQMVGRPMVCGFGAGGFGAASATSNTYGGSARGNESVTGLAGGAAGAGGTDVAGPYCGGGGGGGGGAGPYGAGTAGGAGGNGHATAGVAGSNAAAGPAAFLGAGGGGGGAGGQGSVSGGAGGNGAAGSSGQMRIHYTGAQAFIT